MRRQDLEHLVAAAANIIGDDEFVVIGSQAVLGTVPDPPAELLVSMEADMYPLREPERAIEIDGVLGDGSAFFEAHGYYAHGVDPQTAKAPSGWQHRLVRVLVAPRVPLAISRSRGALKCTTWCSPSWPAAPSGTGRTRGRR